MKQSKLSHTQTGSLFAAVAAVKQRAVEVRLLNAQGWHVIGDVRIAPPHPLPSIGAVVEVGFTPHQVPLQQPVFRGIRRDVELHQCVMSQLHRSPEKQSKPGTIAHRLANRSTSKGNHE